MQRRDRIEQGNKVVGSPAGRRRANRPGARSEVERLAIEGRVHSEAATIWVACKRFAAHHDDLTGWRDFKGGVGPRLR